MSLRALACLFAIPALGCQVVLGIDPNPSIEDGGEAGAADEGGAAACTSKQHSAGILSDNFDESTIDAGFWKVTTDMGSVATDAIHTNAGAPFALHAHTDAVMTANADAIYSATLEHAGALPNHFYIRFFAFVPSSPVLAAASSANLLVVQHQSAESSGMVLYLVGGSGELGLSSYDNGTGAHSSSVFPTDAWACVEWEVDMGTSSVSVSINGTPDRGLSGLPDFINTDLYDDFILGVSFGAPPVQPAFDVWEQDLKIGCAPIGCSP